MQPELLASHHGPHMLRGVVRCRPILRWRRPRQSERLAGALELEPCSRGGATWVMFSLGLLSKMTSHRTHTAGVAHSRASQFPPDAGGSCQAAYASLQAEHAHVSVLLMFSGHGQQLLAAAIGLLAVDEGTPPPSHPRKEDARAHLGLAAVYLSP